MAAMPRITGNVQVRYRSASSPERSKALSPTSSFAAKKGRSIPADGPLPVPAAEFKLARYFTAPPPRPMGLEWQFHGFVQHAVFAVLDSPCAVQVTLSPSFSATPTETLAFILEIAVTLKQPLSASGAGLDDVLGEMHLQKNEAFFGMLTEEALALYR
jgi:uncharacterized protein (TIGR04255 family)